MEPVPVWDLMTCPFKDNDSSSMGSSSPAPSLTAFPDQPVTVMVGGCSQRVVGFASAYAGTNRVEKGGNGSFAVHLRGRGEGSGCGTPVSDQRCCPCRSTVQVASRLDRRTVPALRRVAARTVMASCQLERRLWPTSAPPASGADTLGVHIRAMLRFRGQLARIVPEKLQHAHHVHASHGRAPTAASRTPQPVRCNPGAWALTAASVSAPRPRKPASCAAS